MTAIAIGMLGLSTAECVQAQEAKTVPSSAASVASPSNPPSDSVTQALKLYHEGKLDAAAQIYQQLLTESPRSPEPYVGLTRVYLKSGNVQQADEMISKGVQTADGPTIRVALAEVYFRQGKIPEAEREWANVLNSGHPDARAYLGLSRVDEALSLYKKSKDMIDKAHKLDPDDPDIQRYWSDTLSSSERIKNLEEYLATLKDTKNNDKSDDAKTREHLQQYLDYLKAQQQGPARSCKLVGNVTSTQTDLVAILEDLKHVRAMALGVSVNGTKTTLLLDTGASGILIDRSIAERSGLTKLSDTTVWGIGDKGENAGWVGLASSIKISELEFQNCPVTVMEKRSVVDNDGLIGADVFSNFLVDISFPDRKLKLTELPKRPGETDHPIELKTDKHDPGNEQPANNDNNNGPNSKSAPSPASALFDAYVSPEMKSYSKVLRFGHELLIPTKVGKAPAKLFLIDTGAFGDTIDPKAAREVTRVHNDDTMVKGLSGSVKKVYSADNALLTFGHLRQESQDIVSFDMTNMSDDAGTEISGTLGFTTLNLLDLKIDYRDGLVDFSYDPNRPHY